MADRRIDVKALMDKLGIDRIWSYSRMNSYITCPYSYYLKYVKYIKGTQTSIYSVLGGEFHNIIEKLYNKEIEYKDMIEECENTILNAELSGLKFNKSDESKNDAIANKYYKCLKHYFSNHVQIKEKVITEKDIVVKVGDNYFQGYIDAIYKKENDYIIVDWKSSTIYTGDKILKEAKQLLLYALALNQKGIPLDNIKICWNFLKYNTITYMQKNGKEATTNKERHVWVAGLKSKLRSDLKELKYDEVAIEIMLEESINKNSIDNLPEEVRNKYTINDCYVYVPLNQEIIDNLVKEITDTIDKIKDLELKDDSELWEKEITDESNYFCLNLCSYSTNDCICLKRYMENRDLFKKENEYKDKDNKTGSDSDWLKLLFD